MAKQESDLHLRLIRPQSQTLNQVSTEIPINQISSTETQQLADELLALAHNMQGDTKKRTVVGLAAPQAGVNRRMIAVDTASQGMGETAQLSIFINPVISSASLRSVAGREGCFSTGNVCGIVQRADEIVVEAYDRTGEKITQAFRGFTARIFLHEIDHLDGIRFPDRITNDIDLHWVEPDQFGDYREHWAEWSVRYPRTKWDALKSGETNN